MVVNVEAFTQNQREEVRLIGDVAVSLAASNGTHCSNYLAETRTEMTYTVRRLTPMECERLQGFPDGWTQAHISPKTGEVADQADSHRYKQMGNAVAVPVVEWLVSRIARQ